MGSLPQLSIVKGVQRELIPKKLHKLFESNLDSCKNKTALSFIENINLNPTEIDYTTLNENANQIARLIISQAKQHELEPNQDGDWIVSVCMQPTEKLVTILLAIWKSGAAYLPMDPSFPANRMQHIRKEAQPFLIICDDDVDDQQFDPTITLTVEECFDKRLEFANSNIDSSELLNSTENDLAIVLYTSGSTGVPKGNCMHFSCSQDVII